MSCEAEVRERLHAAGLRVTQSALTITEDLCHLGDHVTVEELVTYAGATRPGAAAYPASTMYRVLERLCEHGLAARIDPPRGSSQYTWVATEDAHHHHAVCTSCGATFDVDDRDVQRLGEALRRTHDFEPVLEHLVVYGECAACRAGAANAGVRP